MPFWGYRITPESQMTIQPVVKFNEIFWELDPTNPTGSLTSSLAIRRLDTTFGLPLSFVQPAGAQRGMNSRLFHHGSSPQSVRFYPKILPKKKNAYSKLPRQNPRLFAKVLATMSGSTRVASACTSTLPECKGHTGHTWQV